MDSHQDYSLDFQGIHLHLQDKHRHRVVAVEEDTQGIRPVGRLRDTPAMGAGTVIVNNLAVVPEVDIVEAEKRRDFGAAVANTWRRLSGLVREAV